MKKKSRKVARHVPARRPFSHVTTFSPHEWTIVNLVSTSLPSRGELQPASFRLQNALSEAIHPLFVMAESPTQPAGSGSNAPKSEAQLKVVMEYLQQHGFDKALQTFTAELQSRGGDDKDADGEDDGADAAEEGARRGSVSRVAVFRAPQPIPLDNMVKRNIPQATTASVSTMSDKITPDFIAQSKYIIEQLQTRLETANADEEAGKPAASQTSFIDPSDRVEGYKRYRKWVSDGLDMWNVGRILRA